MNACSSLHKVRVQVFPDTRINLYALEDVGLAHPRKAGELPEGEIHTAYLTDDGWLVFPEYGCLPYEKGPSMPRVFTLEEAWDFKLVEVQRKQRCGRWKAITSWEEPNA